MSYHWPGNVRELENVIERAVVLSTGDVLSEELLPETLANVSDASMLPIHLPENGMSFRDAVRAYERRLILRALETTGGVQKHAAELLDLKPTTLHEMMKRLDISIESVS
jgi:transcriptional regulator with GAF, ATPase, and Fis domain